MSPAPAPRVSNWNLPNALTVGRILLVARHKLLDIVGDLALVGRPPFPSRDPDGPHRR